MIEQLLLRIAKRGPSLSRLESEDITFPPDSSSPVASSLFPGGKKHRGASSSMPPEENTQIIWELAKDEYQHLRSAGELQKTEMPIAFQDYTEAQALIGAVIWQERLSIRHNLVHVLGKGGEVVAEINPSKRTVAIKKMLVLETLGGLSLKQLPQTATALDSSAASQFEHTTVHMLLWYFGQFAVDAIHEIPNKLVQSKMLLRKLPLVAPNALHLRHLQLISLFSAGAISLPMLLGQLSMEATQSICADLASLYFTGCLVSIDSKGLPA